MFLMRTTKPLVVRRNGIRIPQIERYYNDPKLHELQGQKVYARFNTDDVRQVYVFSETDDFICIASNVELSEHGSPVTVQIIRENNKERKRRRQMARDSRNDVPLPNISGLIASQLELVPDMPDDDTIIQISPVKHKHAESIRQEQAAQAERAKAKTVQLRNQDEEDAAFFDFMLGG